MADIDRATWIRGYAAELAGGADRVTDMHLEDAEQMWFGVVDAAIGIERRHEPPTDGVAGAES